MSDNVVAAAAVVTVDRDEAVVVNGPPLVGAVAAVDTLDAAVADLRVAQAAMAEHVATLPRDADGMLVVEQSAQEPLLASVVAATEDVADVAQRVQRAETVRKRFGGMLEQSAQGNFALALVGAEYVDLALAVAPGKSTRSTAVENLAEEWRVWDAESYSKPRAECMKTLRERVNMLLKTGAVVEKLGDGSAVPSTHTGKGKGKGPGRDSKGRIAWGKLREFAPLVERTASEYVETFAVLPHVAEQAKALLVQVVETNMDRADVAVSVAKLVDMERTARMAVAKAQQEATEQAATARKQEEMVARKLVADAKTAADAAAEQAAKDGTAESAAVAVTALDTLREQQVAAKAATDAAILAAAKAATAAAEQAAAAKKAADAAAKAKAKQDKQDAAAAAKAGATPAAATAAPAKAPATPEASQGTNLLAAAKLGTAKDVAEYVVNLLVGHPTPTDVWEIVLQRLDGHKACDKGMLRSVQAAKLGLASASKPAVA